MSDIGFKKAALVIANKKFRDEELFETKKAIENAGIKTAIVSSQMGPRTGMLGGEIEAEFVLKDLNLDEVDALVFIGGQGASEYFDDLKAQALAKEAYRQGKVVGAICIAPHILANAGLLKDKKAVCFESETEALTKLGAEIQDQNVVIDGKLVTGSGPEAAAEFGQAIVAALSDD